MVYFIFVIAILVLDLKVLGGDNLAMKVGPSLLLLLGIFKYGFFKKGQIYVGKIAAKNDMIILSLALLAIIFSILRTGHPTASMIGIINDVAMLSMLAFFTYLFLSYQFKNTYPKEPLFHTLTANVILAPSLVIWFNLIFYFISYNSSVGIDGDFGEKGYAVILSNLGIYLEKKVLPFSGVHPNTVGIYAGGLLAMSVLGLSTLKLSFWPRTYLIINVIAGLIFVLIVDSRGTIVNSLIAILGVLFLSKIKFLKLLKPLPFIIPILPMLMLSLLNSLSQLDGFSQLSRSKTDLATGNGRIYIWDSCVEKLSDPKTIHYIGYGEYGHYISGVSKKYAFLFGKREGADSMVTHNSFLQALFDVGYIGSFLWLLLLFIMMRDSVALFRSGIKPALPLIGFVMYYCLSGTTESVFGNYNRGYNSLFILIAVTILVFYNEKLKMDSLEREDQELTSEKGEEKPLSTAYRLP